MDNACTVCTFSSILFFSTRRKARRKRGWRSVRSLQGRECTYRNIADEPTSEPSAPRARRPDGDLSPGKETGMSVQGLSAKRKGEAGKESKQGVQCRWMGLHQGRGSWAATKGCCFPSWVKWGPLAGRQRKLEWGKLCRWCHWPWQKRLGLLPQWLSPGYSKSQVIRHVWAILSWGIFQNLMALLWSPYRVPMFPGTCPSFPLFTQSPWFSLSALCRFLS